jgi:CelD/BcsL family acetyltransferase involved in cellulose biosynthesis
LADAIDLLGYAFQSPAWLTAWTQTLGLGSKLVLVVVADTQPRLVLAFMLSSRAFVRVIEPMGAGVSDYHAPLVDPSFVQTLSASDTARLWRDIRRALPPHDVLLWPHIPEMLDSDVPNPFATLAAARSEGSAWSRRLPLGCDPHPLRPRFAKRIAQSQRQLARKGEVTLEVINLATPDTIDELLRMKGRRWRETGAVDWSKNAGFRAFYERVAMGNADGVQPHLSRLRCGDVTVAMHLGVVHRSRFYFLVVGWQGGDWRKYSPGLLLTDALVRHAAAQKLNSFDFTTGDEPYKLEWADTPLVMRSLEQAETLLGHAVLAARKTRRLAYSRLRRIGWLRELVRRIVGRRLAASTQKP